MFKLDLILSLSPECFGYSDKAIREKDDNQEHTKGVGCGHENRHKLGETELTLENEIHHKKNAEACKDSVDDKIINERHFEPGLDGELA